MVWSASACQPARDGRQELEELLYLGAQLPIGVRYDHLTPIV